MSFEIPKKCLIKSQWMQFKFMPTPGIPKMKREMCVVTAGHLFLIKPTCMSERNIPSAIYSPDILQSIRGIGGIDLGQLQNDGY